MSSMFELGASPISSDAPGGESVRDDVRYDQLEDYFQGLDDVPWDDVIKLASGLLSDKGKDLKVAAQLTVALNEERGWMGLLGGYECWKGLLSEEIWPHVQPKRPRGQANAITWFVEKVSNDVRSASPEAADLETLKSLRATAKEVELLFDERMGDKAPQVGSVSRLIRDHVEQLELDIGAAAGGEEVVDDGASQSVPAAEDSAGSSAAASTDSPSAAPGQEEPVREAAPPPASRPAPVKKRAAPAAPVKQAEVPDVPGDGADLKESEKVFRKLQSPVLQTLENIRRAAPERPAVYSLAREWVWALAGAPPAKDGQTSIAGPGTRDLTNWAALVSRGEWLELLHSAENRWTKSMFWLDPHRYVAQALGELGLTEAAAAVGGGVSNLVARLPSLLEISFSDGTPLADEETKSWIAKQASGSRGSSSMGGASFAAPVMMAPIRGDSDDGLPAFIDDAEKLLQNNKFSEAVLGFETGLARVPGRRGRFRLKLKFAQHLLAAGRTHVARPMLEALDEEVERFDLESWEPQLAAGVVQALLAALSSEGQPDGENLDFVQRLLSLRVRLARLEVPSALETGN